MEDELERKASIHSQPTSLRQVAELGPNRATDPKGRRVRSGPAS